LVDIECAGTVTLMFPDGEVGAVLCGLLADDPDDPDEADVEDEADALDTPVLAEDEAVAALDPDEDDELGVEWFELLVQAAITAADPRIPALARAPCSPQGRREPLGEHAEACASLVPNTDSPRNQAARCDSPAQSKPYTDLTARP
jgi:hypothetical protein